MPTISKIFVDQIWDKSGLNKIVDVQESWLYPEDYNFAGDTGSVARLIIDTIECPTVATTPGVHGAQGDGNGVIRFLSPVNMDGVDLQADNLFSPSWQRDRSKQYVGLYLNDDVNQTLYFKNESNVNKANIQLETGNIFTEGTIYAEGNIYSEGDITSEYVSDERLKNVVSTLENSLEAIRNIEPIRYQWNELAQTTFDYNSDEIELGFKAQQIQKYFPEIVVQRGKTEFLKLDYQRMTVVLLSALQELDKKVQELEKRLEEK